MSLPASPHGPLRPALLVAAGTSSFALALGALARAKLPQAEAEASVRQKPAEPGKDLPVLAIAESEDDREETADGTDIAFAWFSPVPVPNPVPVTPAIAVAARPSGAISAQGDADNATPATLGSSMDGPPAAAAAGPELAARKTAAPDHPVAATTVSDPQSIAADPATPPAQVDQPAPKTEAAGLSGRTAKPTPEPRQARIPQPLGAVVANAPLSPLLIPTIDAVILTTPTPRRAPATELAAIAVAPSAADTLRPHAVAAAAEVQQGAIDMRRQDWMGKMVDQIEALRDAAPVRETRLSLAPEALGKVEVSIRHEGDRVHVHFVTETQAARQLIADAQPRLDALAEARGLKLGQTSFESGTAGQGPNRESRDNSAPQQSRTPRPANPDSAVGTADDDRIA